MITYETMKRDLLISLAFLLPLLGCTSTQFSEYRGPDVFEGKGGALKTVDGIDIWTLGEPNRKFKVLGFINQDMIRDDGNALALKMNNSISESRLVREAKKRGADAIVLLWTSSKVVGATGGSSFGGNYYGNQYGNQYGGTYNGQSSSWSSVNNKTTTRVAVVKYLEK
jgi:hypothetical protein